MTTAFAELLENSGFLDGSKVNLSKIRHASIYDILDFVAQSIQITEVDNVKTDRSVLSHTASLTLSGSRHACSVLDCRLGKAQELAQFSVFYSDRIYINNFLNEHLSHLDKKKPPNVDDLRQDFAADLAVLGYLKTFIEAGRIIPITPPHYCMHCLAKLSFGDKDDKRIDKARRELVTDYRKNAHVFIKKVKDLYLVHAVAPEYLLEHGFKGVLMKKLPKAIREMPRLMRAINSGKEVELSGKIKDKTQYNHFLANDVLDGIVYELATTNTLRTSYLTDSRLEINFIKNLTNSSDIENRNHIIEKYLTCFVPFLSNVDPSVILQIRNNEEESFQLFRRSLTEAVNEVLARKDNIREQDARQIYHDIIQPQLAKLDNNVKTAERVLVKDTRRTAIGWTAAISFGLYTGLLPEGVAAAAAALGLTNVMADFLNDTMKKSDVEDKIQGSDMYFLWKVRNEAEKQGVSK